jgi:DNA-binding CsgD family transcriptional regulator
MEFAINRPPYFFRPLEKTEETMRPLSRLYYWSEAAAMPGTSETAMICAVPLIDSNGRVFGVCGYEVSAMLFKLKFMPDNTIYRRIFCMLAPEDGPTLHTEGALFSGSYDAFGVTGDAKPLLVKDRRGLPFSYGGRDGTDLVGNHKSIKLYPEDSTFVQDRFTLGLFMPREDLDRLLTPLKTRWIVLCVLFLLVGIGASAFISHRYINPIAAGLAAIGSQDIDSIAGTNIAEINEIIGQIKARRKDTALLPDNLFEDFIARVKTLTPTEKTIFRHYSEGKTNSEILSLMYISISTFKTHNSHIYNKLGISSREELLLYVKLIQKSGRLSEIE